jgi:FtsP/CotA-like multicopper oxidase with cupredoxin domain
VDGTSLATPTLDAGGSATLDLSSLDAGTYTAQTVIAKDGYPLATPQDEGTVTVAPGERYTVLVHATEPGTWVWHCHILPHAENDQGMFGMVTALVVK